jgi:hypothetical protein
MHRNHVTAGWLLATLLLTGCASIKSHLPSVHWPFGKKGGAVPVAVTELELQPSGGAPAAAAPPAVLQYWERNTLVLDLQNVPAAGQVALARRDGNAWPARIAVRMAPQRFEVVEVRGAQRVVLPVATAGEGAVTAELPSGIYDQSTKQITLSWGAKGDF